MRDQISFEAQCECDAVRAARREALGAALTWADYLAILDDALAGYLS